MPFKKSKSNDALSAIGSIRTGRLGASGPTLDDRGYRISYRQVRWSIRAAQLVCGIIAFIVYTSQDYKLLVRINMNGLMIMMTVFGILMIMSSAFQVGIYVMKFFGKWSARRILSIETGLDTFFTVYNITMFAMMLVNVGKECPAGLNASCNTYNWGISWTFFLAVSWSAALVTDGLSWYRALSELTGTKLSDEAEMELRRARMTRN